MTALVRLYPRAWRDRYETEFLALLTDRPPRLMDRLDILFGALDAHLDPEVPEPSASETRRSRTIRGSTPTLLAVTGALLWIGAVAAMLLSPVDQFGHHEGTLSLMLVLVAQVTLAGAAIALGDRLPIRSRLLNRAGIAALVGAAMFFLGWPLLPLGLFIGFLSSMAVGLALVENGGRWVGVGLALGGLVAFGMNTAAAYMLLALPLALAWIAVGLWSLGDRSLRAAPEPREG